MLKQVLSCLITVCFIASSSFAHGDPILGTVTAVASDTVTIKDQSNHTVMIMLEKNTKYLKDDIPAKKSDLKIGSRVVIDAEMDTKMKMYSAEEIKIGSDSSPKK